MGEHRLYIGDALEEESYSILLGEDRADMVFTDPPYNVKIEGNVADSNASTRVKFKEFAFASGEMNPQEFVNFLSKSLGNMADYAKDGSIHYPTSLRCGDDVSVWTGAIFRNCKVQAKEYTRILRMSACALPPIRGLRCISPSMAQE